MKVFNEGYEFDKVSIVVLDVHLLFYLCESGDLDIGIELNGNITYTLT